MLSSQCQRTQPHSHLGSFLGVAQGSAIRAKDSTWLSLLTLKWQDRKDGSGISHRPQICSKTETEEGGPGLPWGGYGQTPLS